MVNMMCLIGIAFGKFIPSDYLGLLGFLPILNGGWKLFKQIRKCRRSRRRSLSDGSDSDSDVEKEIEEIKMFVEHEDAVLQSPVRPLIEDQNHQVLYNNDFDQNRESSSFKDNNGKEVQVENFAEPVKKKESRGKRFLSKLVDCLRHVLHARVIEVVLVVVGDSGDSLTSSLPLFATETMPEILLTLVVFYSGTAVLCTIAYFLVKCSLVAKFMQKYGAWVRPLMLIALGCYILSDSILGTLITGDDDN
jgi:cadmium resistance protein CadD (predicted permease)